MKQNFQNLAAKSSYIKEFEKAHPTPTKNQTTSKNNQNQQVSSNLNKTAKQQAQNKTISYSPLGLERLQLQARTIAIKNRQNKLAQPLFGNTYSEINQNRQNLINNINNILKNSTLSQSPIKNSKNNSPLKSRQQQKNYSPPTIKKPNQIESYSTTKKNNLSQTQNIFKNKHSEKSKSQEPQQNVKSPVYKYCIGLGNNSQLVKRIIKKRYWWKEASPQDKIINFNWQQTTKDFRYYLLNENTNYKQLLNHFEKHDQISTKSLLFKNLQQHCQAQKLSLFDIIPLTFSFNADEEQFEEDIKQFFNVYQTYLSESQQYYNQHSQKLNTIQTENQAIYAKNEIQQDKTDIENDYQALIITPIDSMENSLQQIQLNVSDHQNISKDSEITTPPQESKLSQKEEVPIIFQKEKHTFRNLIFLFQKNFRQQSPQKKMLPNQTYSKNIIQSTFIQGFNLWLLKPTCLNRGRGIQIFNNLEQFKQFVQEYYDGFAIKIAGRDISPPKILLEEKQKSVSKSPQPKSTVPSPITNPHKIKSHSFIIQKYVESPLLINNRKFDIRVWVLVTQNLEVYFFKEGYLRLSSEIYELNEKQIENKFIHLTNNAVQKYSKNYSKFEHGNQLSFSDFDKYIKQHHGKDIFQNTILPRMKKLCYLPLEAIRTKLITKESNCCFEIFGFDFFIDSDFHLWLIEVNTNPCIEESSPLLQKLLPRMIDDAFKLTLDQIFPKPNQPPKKFYQEKQMPQSVNISTDYDMLSNSELINQTQKQPFEDQNDWSFQVDNYENDINMWETIGNLSDSKSKKNKSKQN